MPREISTTGSILEFPSEIEFDTSDETVKLAITTFANRLRRAGYAESAHFLDIAALILQDTQRH